MNNNLRLLRFLIAQKRDWKRKWKIRKKYLPKNILLTKFCTVNHLYQLIFTCSFKQNPLQTKTLISWEDQQHWVLNPNKKFMHDDRSDGWNYDVSHFIEFEASYFNVDTAHKMQRKKERRAIIIRKINIEITVENCV